MSNIKEQLTKILDKDSVSNDLKTLEDYSRDNSFVLAMKPHFVVKPKNLEQVQEIVKWANHTNTPLVPVSSGPPHFYGDTIPSATGVVILDLRGMNRIMRIDRRNRMTVIEPGVTYAQLQPELEKAGLRVSTPLLPRANKSVVTSLLERQPILVPKYSWTLQEPLKCLEITWGNGETIWTGEAGAGPRSLEKQWAMGLAQAESRGPLETDWHRLVSAAQGTMGIVTWASVKCEILPKIHQLFFIPGKKIEDLLDCLYRIVRLRLCDELMLLNNSNLAYMLQNGQKDITSLRKKLPPWVIIAGIAGRDLLPEERVEVRHRDLIDVTQQFGLNLESSISGVEGQHLLNILLKPSSDPYWKLRYKGDCQDIFFLTTLDKTPRFINILYSLAESKKYPVSDIGVYIQPLHQGVAHHCEFNLPFNNGDLKETALARELFTLASEELIRNGAYFSRPYGSWANKVYNRDAATTTLLKGLKGIFDPQNILNPGKLCF